MISRNDKLILIVGAQKLYLELEDSKIFARQLVDHFREENFNFELVICPSFINLAHVAEIINGSKNIKLGAQNVHQRNIGAFTGQVSIKELAGIKVKYVIVGHSELRRQQKETDVDVNQKIRTCLVKNIVPIACVGENIEQRNLGISEDTVCNSLEEMLLDIPKEQMRDIVIAYEPIWAIKYGNNDNKTQPATKEQANDMHKIIRKKIEELYDENISKSVRIIYGGSVSPENSEDLLKQSDIDGLLIGNASVKINSFEEIIRSSNTLLEHCKEYSSTN